MSVFYVYMRWDDKDGDYRDAEQARQLLICESRYVADEFFRALQDLTVGDKNWLKMLERDTPQFWRYDTEDGNPGSVIVQIIAHSMLPSSVKGRIMPILLNDGVSSPSRVLSIIPTTQGIGRDWINNHTYFIRNIRQPSLYWYHDKYYHGNKVGISTTHKSKFLVRGTALGDDKKAILIRSDTINISALGKSGEWDDFVKAGTYNKVVVEEGAYDWKFKDLLGKFGTTWVALSDESCEIGGGEEILTWDENCDSDEWELC